MLVTIKYVFINILKSDTRWVILWFNFFWLFMQYIIFIVLYLYYNIINIDYNNTINFISYILNSIDLFKNYEYLILDTCINYNANNDFSSNSFFMSGPKRTTTSLPGELIHPKLKFLVKIDPNNRIYTSRADVVAQLIWAPETTVEQLSLLVKKTDMPDLVHHSCLKPAVACKIIRDLPIKGDYSWYQYCLYQINNQHKITFSKWELDILNKYINEYPNN